MIISSDLTQMQLALQILKTTVASHCCSHRSAFPTLTPPPKCSWEFHVCGLASQLHPPERLPHQLLLLSWFLSPGCPCGCALAYTWVVKAFCCFTAHPVSLKNNMSPENDSKHAVRERQQTCCFLWLPF